MRDGSTSTTFLWQSHYCLLSLVRTSVLYIEFAARFCYTYTFKGWQHSRCTAASWLMVEAVAGQCTCSMKNCTYATLTDARLSINMYTNESATLLTGLSVPSQKMTVVPSGSTTFQVCRNYTSTVSSLWLQHTQILCLQRMVGTSWPEAYWCCSFLRSM